MKDAGCRQVGFSIPLDFREHLALIAVEIIAEYGVAVVGQECGPPDSHSRSSRFCRSKLIRESWLPKAGHWRIGPGWSSEGLWPPRKDRVQDSQKLPQLEAPSEA